MRKLLCFFLILIGFLVFIFSIEMADLISIEPWIRNNKTEVLIVRNEYLLDEQIIVHFRNIQEQFDVHILQAIWRNRAQNISIYTTDTTLDGAVSLSSGVFPIQHVDGFISNRQTTSASQVGEFRYFTTQDREVRIYPIEELVAQAGLGGLFFLNTIDEETIALIIRYLEESLVGSVRVQAVHGALEHTDIFAWTAWDNFLLTALIGIACILFAIIAIQYILSMSKHSAVMFIEGYSKKRIVLEHLLGVLPMFMLSFMLITICSFVYLTINSSVYFWWMFIRNNIIFHSVVLALFMLAAFCLISRQTAESNAVKVIAGDRKNTALTILHFSAKYAVLIVIAIAFIQFQVQSAYLRERQQADINWWQTENVYTTIRRAASDRRDPVSMRQMEIGSKHLFEEFSEELGLFLISAHNFQQVDGQYIWERNTSYELRNVHTSHGRSIIINENYLHRHPVYATDGLPAKAHLVYDQFVQNLLVPVSLYLYAYDIYQTFLENFYFMSVMLPNSYNRELGNALDETTIEQLSINMIFVAEGTQYFTYNPNIARTTNNIITDPIAIVDTLNVDASHYSAWLSSSAFFESVGGNPREEMRPHVVRHNMGVSINHVVSVFDLHVASIRETEENLRVLILVGMALLAAFVFSIYAFIASYFEQHKYAIYIKRTFGYSYIRCIRHILLLGTGITVLLLLLSPVPGYAIAALVVIEVLLIMLFSNAVGKKSFAEIIKGVH
ncbi:MAG: DUF1430 domain-containing protein [Oscillospiraceae bacterium]|nr:DUF1430 domain-containing protein [Oscillospiraceae bacterium]